MALTSIAEAYTKRCGASLYETREEGLQRISKLIQACIYSNNYAQISIYFAHKKSFHSIFHKPSEVPAYKYVPVGAREVWLMKEQGQMGVVTDQNMYAASQGAPAHDSSLQENSSHRILGGMLR